RNKGLGLCAPSPLRSTVYSEDYACAVLFVRGRIQQLQTSGGDCLEAFNLFWVVCSQQGAVEQWVDNRVLSNDVLSGIPVLLCLSRWLLHAFGDDVLQLIECFLVRFLSEGALLCPHVIAVPPVHQQCWVLAEDRWITRCKGYVKGWVINIEVFRVQRCRRLRLNVNGDAYGFEVILDLRRELLNPGVVSGQQGD